jgi:CSLREA domain-containing protein
MFFNNLKSLIVRFVLIMALLSGMFGLVPVQAANEISTSTLVSAGETIRVSINSSSEQALYGDSIYATISANGRYIAFSSDATNLVAGDTNQSADIFVHDIQSGATTRISLDSNGAQANSYSYKPSISADGRYIAFQSYATNLAANDTNGTYDIFVHDMQTGTTRCLSVDASGAPANNQSASPAISADGRFVAFHSSASNLVSGDLNGSQDTFVYDLQTNKITLVSVDSSGTQANSGSSNSSISADGQRVAFASFATNLVTGDANGKMDIFVHDMQTGTTTRVSVDSNGMQANDSSIELSISADGRYVAFESRATNLVPEDTNGELDVFVHDMQTAITTRVSIDSNGGQAVGESGTAGNSFLSADGRYVTFYSWSSNLVPADTNGFSDIFVHDLQTGLTTRVSVDSNGAEGNSASLDSAISADGQSIAFYSYAANLVTGDTNAKIDVFVRTTDPLLASGPLLVTKTADTNDGICDSDCSLREAIADIASGGTITFHPSLAEQTIALNSTLVINKDLSIDGSSLASQVRINGNNDVRVFLINSSTTVTLNGLTIANGNSAENGGAIYNDGDLTISNSTLINNVATGYGGAIYNGNGLHVNRSTFVNNRAQAGGAIYVGNGIFSNIQPSIVNSTFVSNQANTVNGQGGAVHSSWNASGPANTLVLSNNTFSENVAYIGDGLYNEGSLSYNNNIFANSTSGGDCVSSLMAGTVTGTNNLVEDGTACSPGYFLSGDPFLGPLQDNGGFTQTMALGAGSPAIDAGDDANCPATDQRGVTRPQGAGCDIGAYETDLLNSAPTNISLSSSSVDENQPFGTMVGTLSTLDPDAGDSHTYAFCGGANDASFSLVGNQLKTAAVFDYETKASYSVCIRSTDSGSLSTTRTFVIGVNNVVDTQTFGDVSTGYWAWNFIERLYNAGITGGCNVNPLQYCPESTVT